VEIEQSQLVEVFETQMMNPIELASVKCNKDLLDYFVNELGFRGKTDLCGQFGMIETMPFIYAPLLQKNSAILKILLDIPTLWSMEDLKLIAQFMKHLKWRGGLTILFDSKAMFAQFRRL
jgi:hypothetical protein